MNTKIISPIFAALLTAFCFSFESDAQGNLDASAEGTRCGISPVATDFNNSVQRFFRTTAHPQKSAVIKGTISEQNTPSDFEIAVSSGSAQYDLDCLEAVLSSRRTDQEHHNLLGNWQFPFRLAKRCSGKMNQGELLIYKVPPSAITYYPGIFKEDDIFCEKNCTKFRNLASNETQLSRRDIEQMIHRYEMWQQFFDMHRGASKKEIRAWDDN